MEHNIVKKGLYQHLHSSTVKTESGNETKKKLPSAEELASDTLKIMKLDLSTLTTAVRLSLERREISVRSLLGHLQSIEAVGPSFKPLYVGHSKPLKSVAAHEFQSLEEIFVALAPYCSWFNHLIIENIIETFCEGDEDVERKWTAFQGKVKRYCERRVIDCPGDQYGEDNDVSDDSEVRKNMIMKVDYNWEMIQVDQLFHIRDSVAKILDIKPFNLYLRTVENGCIRMVFRVPDHAISDISHTPSTGEALHNIGVIEVTYGPESEVPRKHRRLTATYDYTAVPNLHLGMYNRSLIVL